MTKTQTMSERLEELVRGAARQVDEFDADPSRSDLSKLRAIVNVHDRYIATAVREMARRLDALEAK